MLFLAGNATCGGIQSRTKEAWSQKPLPSSAGTQKYFSPMYFIFTSGSTGIPKCVAVEAQQLEAYLDAILPHLLPPKTESQEQIPQARVLLLSAATFRKCCRECSALKSTPRNGFSSLP
jgi:hypothetical protein